MASAKQFTVVARSRRAYGPVTFRSSSFGTVISSASGAHRTFMSGKCMASIVLLHSEITFLSVPGAILKDAAFFGVFAMIGADAGDGAAGGGACARMPVEVTSNAAAVVARERKARD